MPQSDNKGILQVLLNQGVIDQDKVNQATTESLSGGVTAEQIVKDKGWASEKDIVKAKGTLYGIPFVDIANTQISPSVNNDLDETAAMNNKFIIFEKNETTAKAAMANPLDIQAIRMFEQKLGTRLEIYIAVERDLIDKIRNVLSKNLDTEVSSVVEQAVTNSEDMVDLNEEAGEGSLDSLDLNTAPIAKIVSMILQSAATDKASDIHIEPMPDRIRVRYRIHGILRENLTLPLALGPSLVSRIKILAKMPIDEKRKPLDGRFQIKWEDQEIDLRVSTLPTVHGEKVVMRLLRKDAGILSLEDTGMRGNALKIFKEGIKATAGIILITGPTGSGKTVTVATSMTILNKPTVNIVSIEDPVEIRVLGVNQVQVNNDAGLTFASALRSFLRQDPNVISVGEIRDQETAQLAAQAALTGHLVISTLHTNSAAGVLPRLLDMGIEPYIIASTVHVCTAQRLCRRVCSNCKRAYPASDYERGEMHKILDSVGNFDEAKFIQFQKKYIDGMQIIPNPKEPSAGDPSGNTEQLYMFVGEGCDRCDQTGYSGRVGIFEVFQVTEKIGSMVMHGASSDEIEKEAINNGMLKMIQDGFLKSIEGMTTIEEVYRVIHS